MSPTQEEIGIGEVSDFRKHLIETSGTKFMQQKSLVASHKSKTNVSISFYLLRVLTGIGLKL